MRSGFVETANVQAFLAGVTAVEDRGAPEAGMLLVTGGAGFGKTRTVQWWAAKSDALFIRATAGMSVTWLLSELARDLGLAPANSREAGFRQIVGALARVPRPMVVDECEHTLHDGRVIETLRDITDTTEVSLVLVGMDQVQRRIARREQISSRISRVVTFEAATVDDVRRCCDQLCEVEVADDLVAEIHRQTGGRLREVLNAIATVERQARRVKAKTMTVGDVRTQALTHDWQAGRPRRARAA